MFAVLIAASDVAVPVVVGGVVIGVPAVRFLMNNAKTIFDGAKFVVVDFPEELKERKQATFLLEQGRLESESNQAHEDQLKAIQLGEDQLKATQVQQERREMGPAGELSPETLAAFGESLRGALAKIDLAAHKAPQNPAKPGSRQPKTPVPPES